MHVTQPSPDSPPAVRLSARGVPMRKPAGGPPALTKRHLALIRFMVFGFDRAFPRWPDIKPHQPLDVNTAADAANIRRRNARDLFNWPIFVTEYNRALASRRNGEAAASIQTMIDVRDDPGLGKAADRKVQLAAAQALLGEGGPGGVNVTVNTQINNTITAGIVIDMTEQPQKVVEHE